MWRPDIEEVGKNLKKMKLRWIEVPTGTRQMWWWTAKCALMGSARNFTPVWPVHYLLLSYSFPSSHHHIRLSTPSLASCSILPILYLEFTVPGALSPTPFPSILADQFRSCSFFFCLATSLRILPVKSPYLTRSFISRFYKKDGQLYVDRICRGVWRGQASASRSWEVSERGARSISLIFLCIYSNILIRYRVLTALCIIRRSRSWPHRSRYVDMIPKSNILAKPRRKVLLLGSGDSGKSTILKVNRA